MSGEELREHEKRKLQQQDGNSSVLQREIDQAKLELATYDEQRAREKALAEEKAKKNAPKAFKGKSVWKSALKNPGKMLIAPRKFVNGLEATKDRDTKFYLDRMLLA